MSARTDAASTRKGRDTRGRIVEVAAELMQEHGVAATGTPMVRREAGVSSSQIYHYFSGKDDLTRAVVARQISVVVGSQSRTLAEVDDLPGLTAWRDALVRGASRVDGAGGCPIGSLGAELADADEPARESLADGFAAWHQAIRGALVRVTGHDGAEVGALAQALLAAVQGGLLLAQVTHSTSALEAGLDATLVQVAARVEGR